MLSCSCNTEYDPEFHSYAILHDKITILNTSRRKRCQSCNVLIDIGSECREFQRGRVARSEIEERIYGEEEPSVPLANYYECEICSDLRENLESLGYCVNLGDHIPNLVAEHNSQ